MNPSKQRIIQSLDDLPSDSLAALAEFAEFLRTKALTPRPGVVAEFAPAASLGGLFKGYRFDDHDIAEGRTEMWSNFGTREQ